MYSYDESLFFVIAYFVFFFLVGILGGNFHLSFEYDVMVHAIFIFFPNY